MISAKVTRKKLIKKYPQKLYEVNKRFLPDAGALIQGEAKRNLRANRTTNEGQLRSSIVSDVGRDEVKIGSNLEYAAHVEYGTRPHFPPISAIQEWARKKIGDGSKSTAFLIARKISRVGTKAQPFLRPALDVNRKNLVRMWKKYFRRVYGR